MYKLVRTTFVTDEISFKNNKIKIGNYKLLPNLKREVGKVRNNTYFTRLTLDIKHTEERPFISFLWVYLPFRIFKTKLMYLIF